MLERMYPSVSSEKNVIYRTMADTQFFNVGVPKESRQKERAGGSSVSLPKKEREEAKGQSTVSPNQANQAKTTFSVVSGEESLGALFHDGELVDAPQFRQRSL